MVHFALNFIGLSPIARNLPTPFIRCGLNLPLFLTKELWFAFFFMNSANEGESAICIVTVFPEKPNVMRWVARVFRGFTTALNVPPSL